MQIFPTRMCNMTSHETAPSLANGPSGGGGGGAEGEFPENCSVSYLSFVYGRSLWAELNFVCGENSLNWKANMLPLFSVMTLCIVNSKAKFLQLNTCLWGQENIKI